MTDVLVELYKNPPDLNEPQPISNRKESIYGTNISFLILAWIALILRLYTRFYSVKKPWWDDFFVILASLLSTLGNIVVFIQTERKWLGYHFISLDIQSMKTYLMLFYIANAAYVTNTAVIKISLLFQYLRIFKTGMMRWICISLLTLISLWGIIFSFMAWVPCFPVRGSWDRTIKPLPKCYGYGYKDRASFTAVFESHTALNMTFDFAVFFIPMALYLKPNLQRKQAMALTGLFLLGAIVLFIGGWRLLSIIQSQAATYPYMDFTWWAPISITLSCLEIDLAIICACIPIFWPIVQQSWQQIFVTTEVRVTEHQRLDDQHYELDRRTSDASLKSSTNSEGALTREPTKLNHDMMNHYQDRYIIKQVDPLAQAEIGVETNVESDSNKNKMGFLKDIKF